jgi:hypothetical protein
VRNRTVLFSGNPRNGLTLQDTWEWNGSTWTQFSVTEGPVNRLGHRLVYNSDAQRVCVFGSSGYTTGEDLWEWNGSTWTQRTILNTIEEKYTRTLAYDGANHALVTFGGRGSDVVTLPVTAGTFVVQYRPNTTPEACTSSQVDYDADGKSGCADEECWAQCTPLCAPGMTCSGSAPRCGDGTCTPSFEDCMICPGDCGACTGKCGDFHCGTGETAATCPNDC